MMPPESVDWFYFRPGCKSCDRTRERLESGRGAIQEERSSRKHPLTVEEVSKLLRSVEQVWIVRGRRVEERLAPEVLPDDLRGPTGNFRAPMLRRGKRLLVGYQPGALERLLASG